MEISQEIPKEITLIPAPNPVTNNNPPAVPENPEIKTNENLSIENAINNTIKKKDLSIPKNITHAFKGDENEKWIKSTLREVEAMVENKVWIVPDSIPKNAKIINSIMVYRKKEDIDIEDKDLLFKSRLVILGNLQNESQFDPNKISSPVMNSTTTRALVAKAAINKW